MCQLLGVSASAPTRLRFSWERFAMRGSQAGNPDGWGVAYMDERDVHIFREPAPAADSPCVSFLGAHGPACTSVVSHVRRATYGERVLANTQPFVRTLGGRVHVFAHNGHVSLPDEEPRSPWLRPVGVTDSERMFCILLGRLERLWQGAHAPTLAQRSAVVSAFAEEMRARGAANFLYADGLTLFAHGHRHTIPGAGISTAPGLYLLIRDEGAASGDFAPCEGVTGAAPCVGLALVATTPLDEQAWRPLSSGELVRLECGRLR